MEAAQMMKDTINRPVIFFIFSPYLYQSDFPGWTVVLVVVVVPVVVDVEVAADGETDVGAEVGCTSVSPDEPLEADEDPDCACPGYHPLF